MLQTYLLKTCMLQTYMLQANRQSACVPPRLFAVSALLPDRVEVVCLSTFSSRQQLPRPCIHADVRSILMVLCHLKVTCQPRPIGLQRTPASSVTSLLLMAVVDVVAAVATMVTAAEEMMARSSFSWHAEEWPASIAMIHKPVIISTQQELNNN